METMRIIAINRLTAQIFIFCLCLSICPSFYHSFDLSVIPFIHLSFFRSVCHSIYLLFFRSVCRSIYPSVYCLSFFLLSTIFYFFIFSHTTQHNIQNKTKQQTHTQHLKVQSKGRGRGKDNKNTKVTPLYNDVCPTKNTAKHQWLKAWPHQLAPLYIHMTLFAGGYRSNMFFYTCVV